MFLVQDQSNIVKFTKNYLYQSCPNYLGSRAKIGVLNCPKEPTFELVKKPVKEPIIVK